METITGIDALSRFRKLKLIPGSAFAIKFITCDLNRGESGEVRLYPECCLRPARRNENSDINSEHYLYFTDKEQDVPRQCFKVLVREVSFPPENKWYKINWL